MGDGEQEISDFGENTTGNSNFLCRLNQPGTNPSQLAASPLLECKERNLHDSDFNPSRLTRQPFFIDLVDYLDQHDDVILREIKAQFPDVAVDKLMEEYIKAGLILRENKRYSLNLPFLESTDGLCLDQEIFIREDSPVYQALLEKTFETELRNQTNAAILVEKTDFVRTK